MQKSTHKNSERHKRSHPITDPAIMNACEQRIQSGDEEQNEMIGRQINHLIITTTLSKMFCIFEKQYKYPFQLMKHILRLHPTNFSIRVNIMTKILSVKANVLKNIFWTKLKDDYFKYHINVAKGLSIMEIALNKKFINLKLYTYQQIQSRTRQNGEMSHIRNPGQKTIQEKINDYLIEIVQVYMMITVSNLQRYKMSLISDVFNRIKLFSSRKRAQYKKSQAEQKHLKKIVFIIKIQEIFDKNQFRSKIKAFKALTSYSQSYNNEFQQQQPKRGSVVDIQSENPELPIYVSSIKSMITSLNKFEQKEKAKIHSRRQLSAVLAISQILEHKKFLLQKSSLFQIFDSINYEEERDRLEVLERQVMALQEDMEDLE